VQVQCCPRERLAVGQERRHWTWAWNSAVEPKHWQSATANDGAFMTVQWLHVTSDTVDNGILSPVLRAMSSCWDVVSFMSVHPRRLMATYIIQTCTSTPLRTPCYAVGLNFVCGCPLTEHSIITSHPTQNPRASQPAPAHYQVPRTQHQPHHHVHLVLSLPLRPSPR
jgi:hypothetical protein